MKFLGLYFFFILFSLNASAQTLGLIQNDSTSFNGYTLFSPTAFNKTYLIDNCGNVVNEWESDFDPGMMAYLLPNGNLLRTARIGSSFNAGGTGGRLEIFDWDGNLIWSYNYSSDTYHQHHDIEPLPNGNILILAWEKKSQTETIQAGRNPNDVEAAGIWSEKIVEIEPIGTNDINIVWEWNLWDHLVSDYDLSLPNGGAISDHPELIDINFESESGVDWIHANSIDYNPELDQICISSRSFNEFWIIDHSTTTVEAAGHNGGNAGMGGDILYRWGNPFAYKRGNPNDQQLFGQHDAHWIGEGLPDAGKIMIFNNGNGRPDGSYSSIEIVSPPQNSDGAYSLELGQSYGPDIPEWTFTTEPKNDFFAARVSGAQRLPNGNTLICNGRLGIFFEVNIDGDRVWEYINPVGNNGPFAQGNQPIQNDVFQCIRYAIDYEGFSGKNLESGDPIELNPLVDNCEIFNNPISNISEFTNIETFFSVKNNPIFGELIINNLSQRKVAIQVYDMVGTIIHSGFFNTQTITIDARNWNKGMYFVQFYDLETQQIFSQKILKY
jgi:hypothetical protein